MGGQAFWSFSGLFLVQQSRAAPPRASVITMSLLCRIGWDGGDRTPWRTMGACLRRFRGGEAQRLQARGLKIFPLVGWAERGWLRRARGTATRCPFPTSPGVLGRLWSTYSCVSCVIAPQLRLLPDRQTDRRG